MTRHVSRALVAGQVADLLAVLDEFMPASRAYLADDPFGALSTRTEFAVQRTDLAGGSACEVAGAYLGRTTPPTLVVAHALSAGREAFTVLHEFGHFLQATDDRLGERLLAQTNGGRPLEEAACDAFAAELLIPPDLAKATFAGGVTVDTIRTLWNTAVSASRSAVCVTASRHLSAPGHVTLLDADGHVVHDSAVDEPRLRTGSDQTTHEIVARALSHTGRRATGLGRFAYRDQIQGGEMYSQVGDLGNYLVAVAVTDHAPWTTFAPTRFDNGPTARWWTCEHCDHEFQIWDPPCQRCRQPKCPECGDCGCANELRLCPSCHLTLAPAMFPSGSKVCTECS